MERKLYRISRTILTNDADCHDALQNALIKAWTRLSTLRNADAFDAWIVQILINECRQLARGTRRHRHEALTESIAAPSASDGGVHDALFELDEKYRLPIALHYIEGYRISEIAAMLKTPTGTVKSWLHYGRLKLKIRLQGEVEE